MALPYEFVSHLLTSLVIFLVSYLFFHKRVVAAENRVVEERKGRTKAEKGLREALRGCGKLGNSSGDPRNASCDNADPRNKESKEFGGKEEGYLMRPIGYISSCYLKRCGTPRQSGVSPSATAQLKIVKHINSEASLDQLEHYSHLWVHYIFHQNTNLAKETQIQRKRAKLKESLCLERGKSPSNWKEGDDGEESKASEAPNCGKDVGAEASCKEGEGELKKLKSCGEEGASCGNEGGGKLIKGARTPPFQGLVTKISPPRNPGLKVGIFACRTPHRPNPLGLSLARIVKIDKKAGVLTLQGLDVLDGTPVIDIKPYLPHFESHPQATVNFSNIFCET